DVVAALCAADADASPRDRHGRDALTLACLSTRASAATVGKLLAATGADPRATDNEGRSALDCATSAGRWDLVAILDPDTELPASVGDSHQPEPDAATADHLLDALRFGHWAIVGSFASLVREWPQTELAGLYLALADGEHPRACAWLLDHGLDCHARTAEGVALIEAVSDALARQS